MIVRIFRAKIPLELHEEFEEKFKEISVPIVNSSKGLISLQIGRPSQWNPEEFVMISIWKSQKDLIEFAGLNWNQAYIPKGMEKYVGECSVSHYESIEIGTD